MSELLKKEFSRKTFLKGGGALIVSYGALAGTASAATGNTPFAQRGPQDFLPNLNTIDAWLAIRADNTVVVTHGEPEFAGTPTGILMLVAEELDMDMSQIGGGSGTSSGCTTGGGGGSGTSSRSTTGGSPGGGAAIIFGSGAGCTCCDCSVVCTSGASSTTMASCCAVGGGR